MNIMDKSLLVTGGAGFIGSHLCETLVEKGARVTVVDNLSTGTLKNIQNVAKSILFYELDICSPDFKDFLLNSNFDVIFHLAANSYVPPSVMNPAFDFQQNLVAPFQLLETLRCTKLSPILISISSAGVYGNPTRIPISETDPTIPISPYGVSKLATERYVYVYSQLYSLKAASLRFFSVYGPRQRKQIVYDFIKKITEHPESLEILGDGKQVRDLNYVEDVVHAILTVCEKAPLEGEVYNVASGVSHNTREIGEVIFKCLGLNPRFNFTNQIRLGDPDVWVANIDLISGLGFSPRVGLEEGIKRTVDWYLENPK